MNKKSLQSLCRNAGLTLVGSLTLAAVSTISQSEQAAAIDLNFNTAIGTGATTAVGGLTLGGGFTGSVITYTGVATGIDARITATPFTGAAPGGTGTATYSFDGHVTNYRTVGTAEPNGDAGFVYKIAANTLGKGGLTYKIDLFNTGTTTPFDATALRFLVYDVDGENTTQTAANQNEAVRVFNSDGFTGYQVGTTSAALIPSASTDGTSYLFAGRQKNQSENDSSGAAVFYFANTNSVTFQFEADTLSPAFSGVNQVFSAIDGNLSYLPFFTTTDANGVATVTGANSFGAFVPKSALDSTAVPEPFTIIGTFIGGTAAVRMRKKLKATTKI